MKKLFPPIIARRSRCLPPPSLRVPSESEGRSNLIVRYIVLALLSALLVSGCATVNSITKPPGDYRIGTGDELRIVIWKELDEKAKVRPDGKISLPLIGEIECFNKTPSNLSRELTERYKQNTTVMVTEYRTAKDDLKDLFSILRDISFAYFFASKVSDD